MATWKVKEFPDGGVAEDGMSVSVRVVLTDGHEHFLEMPFSQLDWLTQALLSFGDAAYERQIQTGRMAAPNPISPAMLVDGFRVLPNPAEQHALVQLTGRKEANAPRGIGSFVLAPEQIQNLSERLAEVADELRQRSRPS